MLSMQHFKLLLPALELALIVSVWAQAGPEERAEEAANSSLLSPSPRDYVQLYRRACQEAKPQHRDELVRYYANLTSAGSQRLGQLVRGMRFDRECRREPTAWRYRYIDEAGSVAIREESIDERLSNIVYTTRTIKAFAIDSFLYDSGDKAQDAINMELVAGPKVDDDLCEQQLNEMLRIQEELVERNRRLALGNSAILTDQHISLAKILDTFGRYAPGFLYGRTMAMGAYEQCRTNKLTVNQTSRVSMRYCWAHLSLEKHLDSSLKSRRRDHLETKTDTLTTGICIPESCHSRSFARSRVQLEALVSSQFRLPANLYVDETLPIDSIYCLVDENSRFRVPLFGRLLLLFLLLWLLLTISVTIYRSKRAHKSAARSRWAHLDLMESWKDFQQARERADATQLVELNAINVVKVLGSLFVVLAHSLALYIGFSLDEMHSAKKLETDPIMLLMVCASLIVDTFFAISGILWAYFSLKRLNRQDKRDCEKVVEEEGANEACKEETQFVEGGEQVENAGSSEGENSRNGNKKAKCQEYFVKFDTMRAKASRPTDGARFFLINWITLTTFRYLRITPLFVLVHWFKKFVFIYAGSGPLWDHGFNSRSFSGSCKQESMWTPFTFMSAYYPLSHQCTLQSWSISNDMFFSILAPPAIMLVYKRPRLAIWFSLIACFMSFMSAQWAIQQAPSFIDEELRELRSWGFYRFFDKISTLYTAPHFRIFCFLIGVWGGYFLQRYQMRESRSEPVGPVKSHWPRWMRGPGTWLSFAYLATILTAFLLNKQLKQHMDPYYRQIYPQFVSSIRFVWALSNTFIFLRMMTDWKDTFCMRLSSSKFWQILTKLNYPILLVHMDLLLYTLQVARSPVTNVTVWAFINLGFGIFFVCIPISILLHVVFENPFDKLIRSFLPH